MEDKKHLINIYKISTTDDILKIFIGSTKKNIKNINNILKCNKNNNLYNWIKDLNKNNLKIKLIKSYAVKNKLEKKQRENYWVNKYMNYGYNVIHNYKINKDSKTEKIYVCIEDVSMEILLEKFGSKILYMSRESFHENNKSNDVNIPHPPPIIKTERKINTEQIGGLKKDEIKRDEIKKERNYMDELKNILTKRTDTNKSISELTNKKIMVKCEKQVSIILPLQVSYTNILDELKYKIKRVD